MNESWAEYIEKCQERAWQILESFAQETGLTHRDSEGREYLPEEEVETTIVDLLADLNHLTHQREMDLRAITDRAYNHANDERWERKREQEWEERDASSEG